LEYNEGTSKLKEVRKASQKEKKGWGEFIDIS
jgi:hypothetical protein